MRKNEVSEITGLRKAHDHLVAGSSNGMTSGGEFSKVDVLSMSKTPVTMSDGDGPKDGQCPQGDYELESYIYLEGGTLDDESQERLEPGAELLLRVKNLNRMSYYGLCALIWLLALDKPVGQSRRGMIAILTWRP